MFTYLSCAGRNGLEPLSFCLTGRRLTLILPTKIIFSFSCLTTLSVIDLPSYPLVGTPQICTGNTGLSCLVGFTYRQYTLHTLYSCVGFLSLEDEVGFEPTVVLQHLVNSQDFSASKATRPY